MEIKTTIIIPNYNGLSFMEPCFESLKEQTVRDFKVLVVDNMTTYRQDTEALGRAAAELLIEQIESPRTALPEQKLISGSLLKGQSVDVPNP